MNILVMSTVSHVGVTTVASLVAMELASRGQKVCLTHLDSRSEALGTYYGYKDIVQDSTMIPNRLARMLTERVIQPEEIGSYCRTVNVKNFDILSVADKRLTETLSFNLAWFSLTSLPHDIVVFDVDLNDYDNKAVALALERADFVIWVFNQSILDVREFKSSIPKLRKVLAKPSLGVVNKFDRTISSINDVRSEVFAKEAPKETSWLRLRYNPVVVKYGNGGSLQFLHNAIKNGDYTTLDIAGDLAQIGNRLSKFYRKFKGQVHKANMELSHVGFQGEKDENNKPMKVEQEPIDTSLDSQDEG